MPHLLLHLLRTPREAVPVIGLAAALAVVGAWAALRRRPTAEETETRRRTNLAANGRITDGSLIDATPDLRSPDRVIYRYRIAGVTYECAQDVSPFRDTLRLAALDLPVQVRYNRANPGDSIVVAENWNGLWTLAPVAAGTISADLSHTQD
jgi:hypothetical protein